MPMQDDATDVSRAQLLLELGKIDRAFALLAAAAATLPRDPGVAHGLCEFARVAGNLAGTKLMQDPAESIRLNQLAIQAYAFRADTPNDDYDCLILSSALFNLGTTFHRFGRDAEAIKLYGDVLALVPDNTNAANNMAVLLIDANRAAEAVSLIAPFVAKHPADESLTIKLITALQQAGRMDEAVALAKQAAPRIPGLRVMYYGYYYRYEKAGVVLTA
jgi:tetratricopeptide (TPR) repeat protein